MSVKPRHFRVPGCGGLLAVLQHMGIIALLTGVADVVVTCTSAIAEDSVIPSQEWQGGHLHPAQNLPQHIHSEHQNQESWHNSLSQLSHPMIA